MDTTFNCNLMSRLVIAYNEINFISECEYLTEKFQSTINFLISIGAISWEDYKLLDQFDNELFQCTMDRLV